VDPDKTKADEKKLKLEAHLKSDTVNGRNPAPLGKYKT